MRGERTGFGVQTRRIPVCDLSRFEGTRVCVRCESVVDGALLGDTKGTQSPSSGSAHMPTMTGW